MADRTSGFESHPIRDPSGITCAREAYPVRGGRWPPWTEAAPGRACGLKSAGEPAWAHRSLSHAAGNQPRSGWWLLLGRGRRPRARVTTGRPLREVAEAADQFA
jgi:hypothetical protein